METEITFNRAALHEMFQRAIIIPQHIHNFILFSACVMAACGLFVRRSESNRTSEWNRHANKSKIKLNNSLGKNRGENWITERFPGNNYDKHNRNWIKQLYYCLFCLLEGSVCFYPLNVTNVRTAINFCCCCYFRCFVRFCVPTVLCTFNFRCVCCAIR